jgi:hypothetical protein
MKKLLVFSVALFMLAETSANAADMPVKAPPPAPEWTWQFKPAIEVGYASGGSYTLTLNTATGVALLGANRIDVKVPTAPGIYVAGELPVRLTDRLTLALDGRWIFFGTGKTADENYNGLSGIHRTWDTDKRGWGTVDLLLSYAIVKNAGVVKDISPVVGFRWDRYDLGFNNPTNATGVANLPGDTVDFRMNTYAPVFGLTATFAGFRSGNFGGDIKLGVFGSPWIWGDMTYTETFAAFTSLRFEGNNIRGSFVTVMGEATLLSALIAPGRPATLALTAQYTRLSTHETVLGTGFAGGAVLAQTNFDFSASPSVFTVGLKGAIAF